MTLIFWVCIILGIYEGFKKMSDTHGGLIQGTKPSKNILSFLLNE